nr:MAG TPA: hypothetical protein [Caudoviricetes sp.]
MAGFCEVSCVKYCVFTFPLVVTVVQTHGGASSAPRHIHAPTRYEEGTYIRASIASDLDTLSTLNIPSHQVMMMDIFLLGGWVARPSAFLFCALALVPCLILFVLVCLSFSPLLLPVYLALLGLLGLPFVVALPVLGRPTYPCSA